MQQIRITYPNGTVNPPSNGDNIAKWYDLSGNNHHASVASGNPSWNATFTNNKPAVNLSGASLVLDNSAVAFDAWDKLHTFAVFRIVANTMEEVFGKTSSVSSSSNTAWSFRSDGEITLLRCILPVQEIIPTRITSVKAVMLPQPLFMITQDCLSCHGMGISQSN